MLSTKEPVRTLFSRVGRSNSRVEPDRSSSSNADRPLVSPASTVREAWVEDQKQQSQNQPQERQVTPTMSIKQRHRANREEPTLEDEQSQPGTTKDSPKKAQRLSVENEGQQQGRKSPHKSQHSVKDEDVQPTVVQESEKSGVQNQGSRTDFVKDDENNNDDNTI